MKIFVVLVFLLLKKSVFGIPTSPCPQVFLYKFDDNLWHGEINLSVPAAAGRAKLQVAFSVAYYITQEQQGQLTFISDKADLGNSLQNNLPFKLMYKLTFHNQKILPVIETIKLNGQVACQGVPDPNKKAVINFDHNISWKPESEYAKPDAPSIQQSQTPPPKLMAPVKFPANANVPDRHQSTSFMQPQPQFQGASGNEVDYSQICGQPPKALVQLVVNGEPAGPQPWLVSLYEGTRLNYEFFCAGNLITNRHVITAAHCVNGKTDIYMKIGARSLTSKLEPNIKIRTNLEIYMNAEYVHPSSHGDIAIILLNEPVTFATNIQPLCLPPSPNELVGKTGIIVGWGKNENGDPEPDEPKKAKVKVVTQQACAQKDLLKNIISEKTFCAEGATHFAGPCLGDSGGAFTLLENKRYTIRGIISATVGDANSGICDVENYYSVYADVGKFLPWIRNIINTS